MHIERIQSEFRCIRIRRISNVRKDLQISYFHLLQEIHTYQPFDFRDIAADGISNSYIIFISSSIKGDVRRLKQSLS